MIAPGNVQEGESCLCKSVHVSHLGSINQAADLLSKGNYIEAWNSAIESVRVRPFNPDAFLLLSTIAHLTSNNTLSKKLIKHTKKIVPYYPEINEISKKLINLTPQTSLDLSQVDELDNLMNNNWLTACIITKDEEKNISRCIKSILPVAKQVVVVDTGSSDATRDIARNLGAEVYEIKWNNDFSYARNCALEKARGGWILSIDADEELPADQYDRLLKYLDDSSVIAYRIQLINAGKEIEGCCYVPRLFRNIPGAYYQNRIHEQIFASIIPYAKKWGMKIHENDVCIRHFGYSQDLTRIKNARNLNLLLMALEEGQNDSNTLMNLGLELCRAGKIDEGIEYYKKAFEIFKNMPSSSITPEIRETFLTQYSTFLYSKQRYEEVVSLLTSSLAKLHNGLNASHHYLLGISLFKLKKINEAIAELNKCVAKTNDKTYSHSLPDIHSGEPHYTLAVCYAVLNKPRESDKEFNLALKCNPESFKFNYDYARFLAGQGDFEKALAILQKIIKQAATNPAVWQVGARIALNNEKFVNYALKWTEEALKYCPQDPELIEYRGDALLLNGFIEEARECFCRLPVSDRQKACIIFCDVVNGECIHNIEISEESAISREVIRLYRRCLNSKANNVICCFNRSLHLLQNVLPTAYRILSNALRLAEEEEM